MISRITVLALITLVGLFAVPVSTHAASGYDSGQDASYPAWGSASVFNFNITRSYITTQHLFTVTNMSQNDDLNGRYTFKTQVWEQPRFTTRNEGGFQARRLDRNGWTRPASLGGWNYLSLAGLKGGQEYTLIAYTRVNAGGIQIKGEAEKKFRHPK